MRIIGGKFKGKTIVAPRGQDTRPTTDRVRENLFNILSNRLDFDGLRVLDLFAGSGALGLESLSRGADYCVFIEEASAARGAIRTNVETLQLTGQSKIFRRDAAKLGPAGTVVPFDLVFADPPYNKGLGEKAAASLIDGGWLKDGAVFVLEEQATSLPDQINGLNCVDVRTYGDTSIGIFEFTMH